MAAASSLSLLRSRSPPIAASFLSSSSSSSRLSRRLSLLPISSNLTLTLTLSPDHPDTPYGPSLRKGHPIPSRPPPLVTSDHVGGSDPPIDRDAFARVFYIAALRVPADHCNFLESRLRGHLLNWPRVRNVARVPGDDLDPDLRRLLFAGGKNEDRLAASIARHVESEESDGHERLSPVLYREKLAKEFNFRGFVKFRNLAKMSRPKKKKKKRSNGEKEERVEGRGGRGKKDFCVVEVVGDGEEEDWSGLIGDDFVGQGRWRGPTRLLMLDERYAERGAEELPEAVKAVLRGHIMPGMPSTSEILRCRLTVFYDYWSMNEVLEALLPEGIVVPTAFETVGHIAHLNLRDEHLPYKKLIAQVVLDKNKPKIQTVVNKIDAIQNDYRTMQLEVLAGNHSLATTVVENGIRFNVDLATVYWNSRLATERQRLISSFTSSDIVCDVFAGVGPITISAAKKVKHVYANDLNPNAVEYLERNIVLNKLDRRVEVFNMDGRRFISSVFANQRFQSITQVVMNLPNNAVEFLDAFRGIFKRRAKGMNSMLPKIHVYGFSKAHDPEFDFHERIKLALCEAVIDVEMHRVRLVAPGKWMLCGSFPLPETVAFVKQMGD